MPETDFLVTRRAALEERFRSEVSWREATLDAVPDWFSVLLTDLVLAIGDEDIRYLSAKFVPPVAGESGSMAVIVFTDELVAYASLDPDPALIARQFEVIVTARKSLRSYSIETIPGYNPGPDAADGMQISVTYPDFSRTLPLGESDWPRRGSDTAALLQCLRFDVVK
jgi:hypothetical protein